MTTNQELLELTDSEWMTLIRNTEDSGLPTCCANVSALRSAIINIASERLSLNFERDHLLRAWAAVRDGHDLKELTVLEKLMSRVDAVAGERDLTRAKLADRHEAERYGEIAEAE